MLHNAFLKINKYNKVSFLVGNYQFCKAKLFLFENIKMS